ncbi:MAG: leucine--tRNA ligase [Patescibacteria group bacterium]
MKNYDHKKIEQKWQKEWDKKKLYRVEDSIKGKENFYTLVEFTYPSGNLHVGHWYAFAVPDIYARYKRMQGYNVLYPMGFDAFGLPAENAAIKLGADPKEWTYKQMDKMRTQLGSMGAMFDWEREIVSCDPEYYKWTQWMFNKFLEKDLVYRDVTSVNWCPNDKTVLANEQVVDGACERCGAQVEQRNQEQWMLRITKYADRLIDDLDKLAWPEEIKSAQRNWIGRSEGSEIEFKVKGIDEKIKVFTTRADTLFGVTYVVLAPEHESVESLELQVENKKEVEQYITNTKKKSELDRQQSKEKTGVELKGVKAINPSNGEEIPVWVADYVLAGYGTGAVMAVPAHDERDFEFAKKFDLKIKYVNRPNVFSTSRINSPGNSGIYESPSKKLDEIIEFCTEPLCDDDAVLVNSDLYNNLSCVEARQKITKAVGGRVVKTYRLRDWGISRQRYWGTPIPIVYDPEGKAHPVPDEYLPWLLPTDVDHTPDGTSPLARSKELLKRTEKIFGKGWKPEVETMDTFVDSSWYFYRYLDAKNSEEFASKKSREAWMPINLYMGGAEHTTMHLLYSRFWVKAMHHLGLVNEDEAYTVRRNRGLILGPDGNKMSKSKNNVVDPDEIVERLGADTVRMYLAFMGPYGVTVNYPWDPNGVVGVRRFLERVWKLKEKIGKGNATTLLHKVTKKITEDMAEYKFNTAIAQMMILINEWDKVDEILEDEYKILLQILSPFAPHMTEELWINLGEKESIHLSEWPKWDERKVIDEFLKIVVQVNGKVRAEIMVTPNTEEEEVKTLALKDKAVIPWIEGKEVKRVIYVKGRLVSIVL